ncbi:MAG: hypothetical protein HKO90_10590 [Flavobacteriaceae bacterium]|nr:hypothetical protein [Bacteroidia bacterium]NNK88720.1 hypothetical protein [Flavobacteriaceae bacterium]
MKTIKNVQLITWMLVTLHLSGFNTIPDRAALSQEVETARTGKKVEVLVKNSKGKVIYRGDFEDTASITNHFDIANLPVGDYTIEKVYDFEIEVSPFKVTQPEHHLDKGAKTSSVATGQIEFGETYRLYKPVIMSRGDRVYISKPFLDAQDVQISIYNKYNELIYSENIRKKGQIYDLSQVINEDMKFVVWANGRKYSETFKF